jgi:hypothetical protein
MNLSNFYVLVDIEKKIIIDKIQTLPLNWANISGLSNYEDEKLSNLDWAGHKNLGWINIKSTSIKYFSSCSENLNLNKNEFKKLISQKRKEKQSSPILYKEAKIKCDFKTRYSLLNFKLSDKTNINFKCINGYYNFNNFEVDQICAMIDEQIGKYFDIEKVIYEQIDKCTSIQDFFSVNYEF